MFGWGLMLSLNAYGCKLAVVMNCCYEGSRLVYRPHQRLVGLGIEAVAKGWLQEILYSDIGDMAVMARKLNPPKIALLRLDSQPKFTSNQNLGPDDPRPRIPSFPSSARAPLIGIFDGHCRSVVDWIVGSPRGLLQFDRAQ